MSAATTSYQCPHCEEWTEIDPQAPGEVQHCTHPLCRKPFRVEAPSAEPAASLVISGEENQAEAPPEGPAGPAEVTVRTVRPTMLRGYPLRFLGYLLAAGGGTALAILGAVLQRPLPIVAGLAVGLFGGWRLFSWWWKVRHTDLQVTDRRCILTRGFLSKLATEIPYEEIGDIEVHQTAAQRWLRVGDVVIRRTGGEIDRLVLLGMPGPEDLAQEIRKEAEAFAGSRE